MPLSSSNTQENIIGNIDLETPIYRIFSRQRFLELIKSKKNTLVKPSMWDDPFENAFLQCTAIMDDGQEVSLEDLRGKWYGQCWTTEKETDAMWRIYSQNKDGVRVKTTVKKIFHPLWYTYINTHGKSSCFMGKVEYKRRKEIEMSIEKSHAQNIILGKTSMAETLLIKRKEFDHEKEVRILFQDIIHKGASKIHQYDIDLNDTLDEITADPRATLEEVEMLGEFINLLGIKAPFNQSDLYSFQPKKIKFAPDGQQLPIKHI
ncbi:DUF2971 domain-containing protein [Dyella ginsengisoli]|uniref:DUF2971 domain-containing protein n=1 Tax=Dyella ginsengisoli TaxID=363848 RepID=A0ABW8JPE4_9GAMM